MSFALLCFAVDDMLFLHAMYLDTCQSSLQDMNRCFFVQTNESLSDCFVKMSVLASGLLCSAVQLDVTCHPSRPIVSFVLWMPLTGW